MSESLALPENKPKINGKYSTKEAIESAISKILNSIPGNYSDTDWAGVQKLQFILEGNGIIFEPLDISYAGHGEIESSNLPTKKVYRFELNVRDKNGENVPIYLKATCSFIGKTGTMADKEYKLTCSFF